MNDTPLNCPICGFSAKFTGVIFSEAKHLDRIHFDTYKAAVPDFQPADYRIYRCSRCQHQFCSPMPTDAYLGAIYENRFYDNYFSGLGYAKAFEKHMKADFERKVRLIHRLAAERALLPEQVSVLEIGSGPGYFARMLQDSGIACIPVDTNNDAVKIGRDSGIEVLNIDLRSPDNPLYGRKYDLVVNWATIEHIPDAVGFTRLAADYLKPGGLFLCDTGNANDPYLRWDTGFTNWIYPPLHVHYFSVNSLKTCCEKAGLGAVKIYPRSEALWDKAAPAFFEEIKRLAGYGARRPVQTFRAILSGPPKDNPGKYAAVMLCIASKS